MHKDVLQSAKKWGRVGNCGLGLCAQRKVDVVGKLLDKERLRKCLK